MKKGEYKFNDDELLSLINTTIKSAKEHIKPSQTTLAKFEGLEKGLESLEKLIEEKFKSQERINEDKHASFEKMLEELAKENKAVSDEVKINSSWRIHVKGMWVVIVAVSSFFVYLGTHIISDYRDIKENSFKNTEQIKDIKREVISNREEVSSLTEKLEEFELIE